MMTRLRLVIASSLALGLASCGDSKGLYAVRGKVMFRGVPAAGASLYFHREGASEKAVKIPTATVEEDGDFEVATEGLGRGAPAGRYRVLVEWRDKPTSSEARPPDAVAAKKGGKAAPTPKKRKPDLDRLAPDKLRGRYCDPNRPLLFAEVKPETNELPAFELNVE